MTASLALGAAALIAGFAFGGHCAWFSFREREAAAYRARDRAICAAEDAQAEAAHWRDVAATPVALRSARA